MNENQTQRYDGHSLSPSRARFSSRKKRRVTASFAGGGVTSDGRRYCNSCFKTSGALVGGWQALPVQTKAVAASFVDKVLANGSTAPVFPKIILFGA